MLQAALHIYTKALGATNESTLAIVRAIGSVFKKQILQTAWLGHGCCGWLCRRRLAGANRRGTRGVLPALELRCAAMLLVPTFAHKLCFEQAERESKDTAAGVP